MKKFNVIIDTDPGVDDAVAIIPALFSKKLNIVLFTTTYGNVELEKSTNNLLHLLDVFKQDIPVAKGADKPFKRPIKNAKHMHGENGLGGYTAKEPKQEPVDLPAVEAMYEAICKHKNDISLILLGPHTNAAALIKKHPDVVNMISHIVFEGTSDWENRTVKSELEPHHVSFNASCDPEALKIVLNSGIPMTVIPSEIGRAAKLTPEQLEGFKEGTRRVGGMVYKMLSTYWEQRVQSKFVATNDTCAIVALTNPRVFKTKKGDIVLNTTTIPGKTEYIYSKTGKINIIYDVKFKKFYKLMDRVNLSFKNRIKNN